MAFNFLNFLGRFGDKGDDDEQEDRSGALGFLQGAGEDIAHSVERAGRTGADFLDPRNQIRNVGTIAEEGAALIRGDDDAYQRAAKRYKEESKRDSYIHRTYGSKFKGDTSGLGEAVEFGLDVGTAPGVGSLGKLGAKAAAKAALKEGAETTWKGIGKEALKETAKGAAIGAGYGEAQNLKTNEDDVGEGIKNIGVNAGFGAALGPVAVVRDLNKVGKSGAQELVGGKNAKRYQEALASGAVTWDTPDGKPRFEIDDSETKFDLDKPKGSLPEIMQHPTIYDEYGALRGVKVRYNDRLPVKEAGYFDPETFTMVLNPKAPDGRIKDTMVHETQHVIQVLEDFASGGNLETIRKYAKDNNLTEFQAYWNLAGEAEARNAGRRRSMTLDERVRKPFKETFDVPVKDQIVAGPGGEQLSFLPGKADTTPEPQLTPEPKEYATATDKLDAQMVKGIKTKEERAVKLSDVETGKEKGAIRQAGEGLYSTVTQGRSFENDWRKAMTQLSSRYIPLSDMDRKFEELTGAKLDAGDSLEVQASLTAGTASKLDERITELHEGILKTGADVQDVKRYGVARQIIEDRVGDSPISREEAAKVIAEMEARLGPGGLAKVEKATQHVQKQQEKMLEYMGEVIGKDAVDRIKAKHRNYFTPFQAVDYLIDNQQNIRLGSSFSRATQDFIKKEGTRGFTGEMADPMEAIIRQWGKAMAFVESNKVGQALGRMADKLGDENDLAIKMRDADDVAARMDLFKQNKEFRPVRDALQKAVSRDTKAANAFVRELAKLDKELAAKIAKFEKARVNTARGKVEADLSKTPELQVGQKLQTRRGASELENPASPDAVAAARNLSEPELKEILGDVVNWDTPRFARVEGKIALREGKVDDLMEDILSNRDRVVGIRERMKQNRETAHLLGDKPLPEGYEKVSYFRNGIKEEVAVPKEVAESMSKMNAKQADFITKTASLQTQALRAGATYLNIAFIPKNIVRDYQTAMVNTKHQAIADMAQNWIKAFGDAWVGGPTTKAFIEAGGGSAGFFSRNSSNISRIASRIGKTKEQQFGQDASNAKDLLMLIPRMLTGAITKVGNAAELAPRLAEFKAATAKGESAGAAAMAGRNITVDFARAGEIGQIANQWVPFLNARAQGTTNIFKSIKRDPVRASAVIASTLVAPAVATYIYNRQYHNDVYTQIPGYVKDNNFIIIVSDEQKEDKNGNITFPGVIKIPKGEVGMIFGNPLENLLDYAFDENPESLSQIAIDAGSTISPIPFAREGKIDPALAVTSALPPAARGTIENTANYSFFRGAPVVSEKLSKLPAREQYNESTSPAARALGEATGLSPLKTDNFIQAIAGGVGQQLADPKKIVTAPARAFVGTSGAEVENQFYNTLDRTAPLRASASKRINEALADNDLDTAQELADQYNKTLREEFSDFRSEYGQYADDDLKDLYAKQKIRLTAATIKQRRAALREDLKKKLRSS